MKHIVIDARLYGPKHTGIGRYTQNLLVALKTLPNFKKYRFTLLVYPDLLSEIKQELGPDFNYYPINVRHYSLTEQLLLPIIIAKLHPDLVHFTHLDKPIFYLRPSIVTIHDLIRHFSKGTDTTTKHPLLYWPKYLGYLLMTKIIFLTSHLIVPSNYWRHYIINKFKLKSEKITTTYEAVDPKFLKNSQSTNQVQNYLIYTGNLYPHKNITVVIEALKLLPNFKLKIICARSVFQTRLEKLIKREKIKNQVEFLGYIPDAQFSQIYSSALALVHPALIEGFSLTGLEAMALNCPVIAANSSCLPEIYGQSVLYFDPHNPQDLAAQIKKLQKDPNLRQKLLTLGHLQVGKYSWTKTATQTLSLYEKILT